MRRKGRNAARAQLGLAADTVLATGLKGVAKANIQREHVELIDALPT